MTVLYGLTAPFTDAGLHIASYNNGLHSVQILSWSAGVGDGKTAFRRRQSQEVAEADPRRTELSRQPRVVASVPGASARNSHVRRPAHRHSGNTQDRLVQLERVFIVSDVVIVEKLCYVCRRRRSRNLQLMQCSISSLSLTPYRYNLSFQCYVRLRRPIVACMTVW